MVNITCEGWTDVTHDISADPFDIWPRRDIQAIKPRRFESDGKVGIVRRRRSEKVGDIIDILAELVVDPGNWMPCDSLFMLQ